VIRHSFATHMLTGGAGINHVKKLLGHIHIGSTVIYTHLDTENLRKIVKMYHPRENELYEEFTDNDYERCINVLKN
jgi:site-specific recombinase XerD